MEINEKGALDRTMSAVADRTVERCVERLVAFDMDRRKALSTISESLSTAVSMLNSVGYADTSKIRQCMMAAQVKLGQENTKLAQEEAAHDAH